MCAIEYYTYDDYKLWEGDWELIYGQAIAMAPAPVITHQAIAFNIAKELDKNLKCDNCLVVLEEDWIIADDTVLKPDVALICGETGDFITKAPKIVVEVISPSTARRDEKIKFDIYEKEKVKYYIIVYPDDLYAKVYKLDGKSYDKQGDFSLERYDFEETKCGVSLDFEKVFQRFR